MAENKTRKLPCSFCGKEIECPENMLGSEKHACFECFKKIGKEIPKEDLGKIHVDIPTEEIMQTREFLDAMVHQAFEEFFSQSKNDLKQASKKEAMREAFGAEAAFMLQFMEHMPSLANGKTDSDEELEEGRECGKDQ